MIHVCDVAKEGEANAAHTKTSNSTDIIIILFMVFPFAMLTANFRLCLPFRNPNSKIRN
jgi:hypothetical protein